MLKLLWILLFSCFFAGAFAQMNLEENRATLTYRNSNLALYLRIHGFADKEGSEMRFEESYNGESFKALKTNFVGKVNGKRRWTFVDDRNSTGYLEEIGLMSIKYVQNDADGTEQDPIYYGLETKMENGGDVLYIIFADAETYLNWMPQDPDELSGVMTIKDYAAFQDNILDRENMRKPIQVLKPLGLDGVDPVITIRFLPSTAEEQQSGSRRLEWKEDGKPARIFTEIHKIRE